MSAEEVNKLVSQAANVTFEDVTNSIDVRTVLSTDST